MNLSLHPLCPTSTPKRDIYATGQNPDSSHKRRTKNKFVNQFFLAKCEYTDETRKESQTSDNFSTLMFN